MNRFYNTKSGLDQGTLYQLRCMLNRRNISVRVKEEMNQLQDFFHSIMKAHILAGVMDFFDMEDKSSQPAAHRWSSALSNNSEYKRQYLFSTLTMFVDKYVMPCLSFSMPLEDDSQQEASKGSRRRKKGKRLNVPDKLGDKEGDILTPNSSVRNYAMALLTDLLMAEELIDAVREGDGDRVIRFWRHMLLYCTASGHTKYAYKCFNLLLQISGSLTTQEAYRVKWCRFANTKGGTGHNLSGDLLMEHWNRDLKTHLCAAGANISSHTIIKTAKALSAL